jgi:predicted DNA-binding protein (UPF0251 family)
MPRPVKRRRICNMPSINAFGPYMLKDNDNNSINMTVEEFETIRLIDYEQLSQEQCSKVMEIGRSTVQRIYDEARKKIADSMVNAKVIKIEGGNYIVCKENSTTNNNGCGKCFRRRGQK